MGDETSECSGIAERSDSVFSTEVFVLTNSMSHVSNAAFAQARLCFCADLLRRGRKRPLIP